MHFENSNRSHVWCVLWHDRRLLRWPSIVEYCTFVEWLHDSSILLQAKLFSICYIWLYVWESFHNWMWIRVETGFRILVKNTWPTMKSIHVILVVMIIGTVLTSTGILHRNVLPHQILTKWLLNVHFEFTLLPLQEVFLPVKCKFLVYSW